MPPPRQTTETDEAETPPLARDTALDAEQSTQPGPAVIDGPFGTTVDSADPNLGTLRVEVRSNVTLGNRLYAVGEKAEVPDDATTRGAIAVGHLRLLDDDEALDGT